MARIVANAPSGGKVRIGTLLGKAVVIGNPNLVTDDEFLAIVDTESDDIKELKQRGNRLTGSVDADGFETIMAKDGEGSGSSTNVNVISLNVSANGSYSAPSGSAYSPVVVNVHTRTQVKSITPQEESQVITPDSGYDGLSQVNVSAIPIRAIEDITPSATEQTIAFNNQYIKDVVIKAVESEEINVELTTEAQTILPTSGKWISKVNVPPAAESATMTYNAQEEEIVLSNFDIEIIDD